MSFRVSQISLFSTYVQKRTRRANNAQNGSASRTQRTQGRNIPFGGTPHSDECLDITVAISNCFVGLEVFRVFPSQGYFMPWHDGTGIWHISRAFRFLARAPSNKTTHPLRGEMCQWRSGIRKIVLNAFGVLVGLGVLAISECTFDVLRSLRAVGRVGK